MVLYIYIVCLKTFDQAVTVFHVPAPFPDPFQRLDLADRRQLVLLGIQEKLPGILRSNSRITQPGQQRMTHATAERLGEETAQTVDVLPPERLLYTLRLVDPVEVHHGRLEVVAHADNPFGPDDVDIRIMSLVFGKLPVNEALGNIENHAVGESAVALYPPGVLVIPHIDSLRVPALVFTPGIPPRNVNVMHPAVVESRPLMFVPLARHKPRSHVADAEDGQLPDFTLLDVMLHVLVVP